MLCEKQRAHHHYQREGRKENGGLVEYQQTVALPSLFVYKSVHDKDTVVHPHPEDERWNNDIYQVKRYAEQGHHALNYVPAKEHRRESN